MAMITRGDRTNETHNRYILITFKIYVQYTIAKSVLIKGAFDS